MKRIYQAFSFMVVVLYFACGSLAPGQTYEVDNSYKKWSRKYVEKILNDSPWVSVQEVRIRREGQAQRVAGAPPSLLRDETNSVASGGSDIPIDFIFTLRMRSALPIREALVRQKQLDAKYDSMDEKQKAAFDAGLKGFLGCPACAGNYVLTLSSKSKNSPGADAVYTTFKGARIEDIKRYIHLANERGERRELVHFVVPKVPGEEAVFFFPRLDDKGNQLFGADSKEAIVNLTNNEVSLSTNFRFDISKLVSNGQVLF
ncbi:MAG: hypothetical protein ACR2HX_13155 [Pyrinomonadaceae bacterium]